jgi:hypothetical protein
LTAGGDWERVEVNAYACPRISARFLDEERRSLPRLWFESEYMCQFTDTEDQVFPYDDVMNAVVDAPLLWGGGR